VVGSLLASHTFLGGPMNLVEAGGIEPPSGFGLLYLEAKCLILVQNHGLLQFFSEDGARSQNGEKGPDSPQKPDRVRSVKKKRRDQ
jgi:hypothetical protein